MQMLIQKPVQVICSILKTVVKHISECLIIKSTPSLARGTIFFVSGTRRREKTVEVLVEGRPEINGLSHRGGGGGKKVGFDTQLDHAVRADRVGSIV